MWVSARVVPRLSDLGTRVIEMRELARQCQSEDEKTRASRSSGTSARREFRRQDAPER